MALPKKALISVTSAVVQFYADGKNTGLFYTEALHPWEVFTKNGFEVVLASESGTYGLDDHSTEEEFLNGEDRKIFDDPTNDFNLALKAIKKASDIDAKEFGVFFASAGHATLFDYPEAKILQAIASDIYERGGVVAAICHGPAILPGIKDKKTGDSIIKGKKVTGFTDLGEKQMGLDKIIEDFHVEGIEHAAAAAGGIYQSPSAPFIDFSIRDGRIVTGANPASARSAAEKVVDVFKTL